MASAWATATAELLERELRERAVPYWSALRDRRRGGFRLADEAGAHGLPGRLRLAARTLRRPSGGTAPSPGERHLVGQARMVYALSLAARLGHDPSGEALAAAAAGHRFLAGRLADREAGGHPWTAGRGGRPRQRAKLLYGHAFALLALVEHHRASGDAGALDRARELFALIEARFRDRRHGGWHEHLGAGFEPWPEGLAPPRGLPGLRSHDALLHLVEALAELYAATRDPGVATALREALARAQRFLPGPGRPATAYRRPDDSIPHHPAARRVYYGHLFEHAWLALRAADALGDEPPWEGALALVGHAVEHGFDAGLGGVLKAGLDGGAADDPTRESWAQAEALLALALAASADARFQRPLELQVGWVLERQRSPAGAWLAAVGAEGRCVDPTLAGSWKAAYHEVRALAFTAAVLRGERAPWR